MCLTLAALTIVLLAALTLVLLAVLTILTIVLLAVVCTCVVCCVLVLRCFGTGLLYHWILPSRVLSTVSRYRLVADFHVWLCRNEHCDLG